MKALSLFEYLKLYSDEKDMYLSFIGLKESRTLSNVVAYADFLSQPFKPELITELFEGWDRSNTNFKLQRKNSWFGYGYVINFYLDNIIIIDETINADGIDEEIIMEKFPIPKTLADFITFCGYADIELQFKELK